MKRKEKSERKPINHHKCVSVSGIARHHEKVAQQIQTKQKQDQKSKRNVSYLIAQCHLATRKGELREGLPQLRERVFLELHLLNKLHV